MSDKTIEVRKNADRGRFEILLDGKLVGIADYRDDDGIREFPHTEVDPAVRGEGLAGRLVGEALKDTREAGLKVDPVCPYVATYFHRHPEYKELLA